MSRDNFGCHNWGSCYWHPVGKGRHATKHRTLHTTAPHKKEYPAQDFSRAEFEPHSTQSSSLVTNITKRPPLCLLIEVLKPPMN